MYEDPCLLTLQPLRSDHEVGAQAMTVDDSETLIYERAFGAIKSAADVGAAIAALRDCYEDVAHVTYHHAQTITRGTAVDAPFVRTTYPDSWVARYLLKGYVSIDPIVREGLLRQLPFDWTEVDVGPECFELFADFQKSGLSPNGYSIPVIDKVSRRALVSFNAHPHVTDWTGYVQRHQQDWAELAHTLHRKAVVELYGDKDPLPQISPRELETLYWIGQGKESKDIAIILAISEHTVRTYMRSVRFKLDCANLSQAVAKAMSLRLIKG